MTRSRQRIEEQLRQEEKRLAELEREKERTRARVASLRSELDAYREVAAPAPQGPTGSAGHLSPTEKVTLFRSLFRGRAEVFPTRFVSKRTGKAGYTPACANKWEPGLCGLKTGGKCSDCPNQAFVPVSDEAIRHHLEGRRVMGVYPLLADDTCWLLGVDFDKEDWRTDIAAFRETCERLDLPVGIERSRSGNGAHAWFFFTEPVSANTARRLGCHLLTETMSRRPELGLASYDRLFPNQDTLPRGGFGNLIALPLQREVRRQGNSVFLDHQLEPIADQWAYLGSLSRLTPDRIERLARDAGSAGRVIGVGWADATDPEDLAAPWTRPPSGLRAPSAIQGPLPEVVQAVLAQRLFIEKRALPPALVNRLIRVAAFQNPEFYAKQRMRLTIGRTPRLVARAEDLPQYVSLPRGCLGAARSLLAEHKVELAVEDQRFEGEPVELRFRGELTPIQQQAARALLAEDAGIFVGPPGIGKTVLGTFLIAERARSALILVHRKPLLDQWIAQLAMFLGIEEKAVGQIGGGKRKPNGRLDVAMIQSLSRKGVVDDLVAGYGHVVIDESHHVSAVSFEQVLGEVKARYVLGLTATPERRDRLHPIAEMQLGPVRFRVDAKDQASRRSFEHRLLVRETAFRLSDATDLAIQDVYRALATDRARNEQILEDVVASIQEGRSPIVLTERKDHLEMLADRLRPFVRHLVVLHGGTGARKRREALDALASIPSTDERLVLATGRYVGEGFDDARLDTLFLAMPIAWKGTLVQYAGRLHRHHSGKREVRIYDYVDRELPMLLKMFEKRLRAYRAIGYARDEAPLGFAAPPVPEPTVEWDEEALRHFDEDF